MELNHVRAGAGPSLVLIHGIGSRWQMWEPVLDRLAAERDVVALDLPGFAASPMPPPGTPPGIPSLTRLVDEFLGRIGVERPHVAGNSLGGWVALELAKRGRASSTTGLSPAGFHNRIEARYQFVSLWFAARAARAVAPRAERILARPGARRLMLGQYFAHPERMTTAQAADNMRALANAGWFDETLSAASDDRFQGGELIQVPVTIAWGERDRVLVPRQSRRAARELPRPRMRTLRGCGHVPTYDDPAQVAEVLLEGSSNQ